MATQTFEYHQPGQGQHAKAPVTRASIDALKVQIAQAWAKTKVNRLETGQLLVKLNQDLAKPGYGQFGDAVEELGIGRTTAYKYMRLYRESQGATSKSSVRARTDQLPLPKLELKTLKSLAGTPGFEEELSGELTAIANAVAYRYGHIAYYTVTLAKQPPLPTEQKPVPTFKK